MPDIIERYAVVYSSRSCTGDPLPVLHSEYRSEKRALRAARKLARRQRYVWLERWIDLPRAATRTATRRKLGCEAEEIVAKVKRKVLE